MDSSQTGLAGEFYALAQLTHRDLVATLTLGNTKGVDILVTNQELNKLYKVEVKTSSTKAGRAKQFGDGKFYSWTMGKKHETIVDENLVYCFIKLLDVGQLPLFFLVDSHSVAKYVKWQHEYWLSTDSKRKDSDMRQFRIPVEDPEGYQNNWKLLGTMHGEQSVPPKSDRAGG